MRENRRGRLGTTLGWIGLGLLIQGCQGVALLDPKGPIGEQQRDLLLIAVGLGLIVILPVFAMVAWFSIRYREKNTKATYKPHWEGNLGIEAVIWLVPVAIIVILSYLTFVKTTELDPYKPIESTVPTVRVQVVSMDWNWLFIYPELEVASVNELVIPAGAPISFDLTSNSVMTSFFIPQLGSQIYAMAGMTSHLNLLAHEPGEFRGHNMSYSGFGYASMQFTAKALAPADFEAWVQKTKGQTTKLDLPRFAELSRPQKDLPVATFASVEPKLFETIVAEAMGPMGPGAEGEEPTAAGHQMPMGDSPATTSTHEE